MGLTASRLRELMKYDPETGIFTRLCAPGRRRDLIGAMAGHVQSQGYIEIAVDGGRYKAHRLAWLYMTGDWPAHTIDHRNTMKGDNRFYNLREATKSQNEMNKPVRATSISGVRGVHWDNRKKHWRAGICVDGRTKYIGAFQTLEKAASARRKAELRLYGEFAFGASV